MTFLSPWSAVLAGAVAVPLLLLLYVLKLRRQRARIASTLLWRKSFEDLQANVPFQRLRWSWLLLLQLLLLLLLVAALGRPALEGRDPTASRLILLIDRSASMNAIDAGGEGSEAAESGGQEPETTRLDKAKQAASELVERLTRSGEQRRLMVLSFAADARVVCGFTRRRAALLEAIESIEPTDEEADLGRALQLAGAFAVGGEDDETGQPPDVLLISDGGVGRPEGAAGFTLRAGGFRYLAVGPEAGADVGGADVGGAVDNLGIAAFSARRDYQDPGRVLVYARLVNASPEPIETVVTLLLNDEPAAYQNLTVPGAEVSPAAAQNDAQAAQAEAGPPPPPGEASVSMSVDCPGAAILSIHHNHRDALEVDDVAALVMAQPRRPRIALVHPGDGPDAFLEKAIEDCEPESLRQMSEDSFESRPAEQIDSAESFDLIVFDRVSPDRLPAVPTVTVGGVPAGVEVIEPAREGGKRVLSWDRQHPVMRYVSLDTVIYAGFGAFQPPAGATVLAYGPDGPIMAVLRSRGARHVIAGFALAQSDWPMQVSFVVFVKNVLDYLTLGGFSGSGGGAEAEEPGGAGSHAWGQIGLTARPGRPVSVRALPGVDELVIEGPQSATAPADAGRATVLPVLRRAGLYVVKGAAEPMDQLALSVLSDEESDIRPRRSVTVNAEAAAAGSVGATAPLELWPYLAAAALLLLVAEWLWYCRRVAR